MRVPYDLPSWGRRTHIAPTLQRWHQSYINDIYVIVKHFFIIMAKDRKLVPIGNLLKRTIYQAGIGRQVEAAQICDYYHKALLTTDINKKALEQSKAIYYRNQILTIAVLGSAWAQEIQLRQHLIVAEINKYFKKDLVKRINYNIS
jgi:hypothetical protein